MLNERDHKFATDVLNASLTLMSILVAVITILAVEYSGVKIDFLVFRLDGSAKLSKLWSGSEQINLATWRR